MRMDSDGSEGYMENIDGAWKECIDVVTWMRQFRGGKVSIREWRVVTGVVGMTLWNYKITYS